MLAYQITDLQKQLRQRSNLYLRAVRQVVANCLYGADINDMAVEMCKLSLWLVSLDRDLPFSFVDDKVFHGNSLLGLTDLRQLKALHIDPTRTQQRRLGEQDIDDVIHQAVEIRRRLANEVSENDPQRSASAKYRQLARFRELTAQTRAIADGVIAAGLWLGGKPGRQLDEAYQNLRQAVADAYPTDGKAPDPAFLERITAKNAARTSNQGYHNAMAKVYAEHKPREAEYIKQSQELTDEMWAKAQPLPHRMLLRPAQADDKQ